MRPTVLLASTNPGKLREWTRLLREAPVRLVLGEDLPSVEEGGKTYEANALLKARAWGDHTDLPVLAEDSGLEVPALGNRPGIHSARMGTDDEGRIRWLLEALGENPRREARFVCVAVLLASDRERVWTFRGECEGTLLREPRGTGGFGYDPVFLPAGSERSAAELRPEEKDASSHRGRALEALLPALRSLT